VIYLFFGCATMQVGAASSHAAPLSLSERWVEEAVD
jgi:hypothetical protein